MDFLQAEAQFRQLDAQYKAGQMTYDQYRQAMVQLQVTDSTGRLWQIQEQSGQWFVLTNGQWMPSQPPVEAANIPSLLAFFDAEQQFAALEAQFQAGQITMDYYREALARLEVTDESQNRWRMQERTGVWHVLWQGQWVASTPQGMTAQPGIALGYPPQNVQPRKKLPWGVIAIVAGGLLLVLLVVVGLSTFLKGGAASSKVARAYAFDTKTTLTLKPGGGQIQDDHGTTLQVAKEALPAEDSISQLTVFSVGGEIEKELSKGYTLETPFYMVSLEGENDGSGPAVLTFLAPNPDSRLMMIVDLESAILMSVKPQDGKILINAHLGPMDPNTTLPDGDKEKAQSILYVVVTPKQSAYQPSIQMASHQFSQESFGKSCSPVSIKAMSIFQRCQSNEDGTVAVIYPAGSNLTHIDAYNVSKEIEAAMNAYFGLGYSNANLTLSTPMLAVVSADYTSPEYNFKNGVIYLPPDIPTKLATERMGIYHEVAHWIQNRVYSMMLAKASKARSWWMDVSAEMMVMDDWPDYLVDNLTTYGKITKSDNVMLAFQSSPYQWPADFYVHAQLVMVNMCDLGCPISHDGFVNAINRGLYPFNNSYEQDMLTSNMEDYARYLLGAAPVEANTEISLAGVQNQDGWGQVITVTRSDNSLLKFIHNGVDPQIKEEKTQTGSKLLIDAALEKDGAYPLQISSGSGGTYTGLPLMLVIEPGVPFLYRLDGGEVVASDGGEEVKLGPLQAGSGVGTIRLVAYSKTGGQSFKAKVEPVNLDGVWVILAGDMISSDMQCTGGVGEKASDPDDMGAVGAAYFGFFNAMGDMITDSSGQTLEWNLVPERLPAEVPQSVFTFQSVAITETDGIHLQASLNIPKSSDASAFIPDLNSSVARLTSGGTVSQGRSTSKGGHSASLAAVVLLPAIGMSLIPLANKRRRLMLAAAIGLMALSLAGCFVYVFYGSVEADIKITRFNFLGGTGKATWTISRPVSGNPIWVFEEGTATYPVELMMDVTATDTKGKETDFHEVCSGTIVYAVSGGVYEDITVIVPSSSE